MIALLLLGGCAVRGVEVRLDPGEGAVEHVAEVVKARMHAVGARRYAVRADGDVVVTLREEDRPRLDAVLVPGRMSIGWEDEEPFLADISPRDLVCIEQMSGVQWALRLTGADGDVLLEESASRGGDTLVIVVDGERVAVADVMLPITGGTATLHIPQSYRDCRVMSASVMGGPLPEGVRAR